MFARETPDPGKTRVVAQCRDADFERLVRSTFGMDGKVGIARMGADLRSGLLKLQQRVPQIGDRPLDDPDDRVDLFPVVAPRIAEGK